ncbi:hypothetical protein [Streptomyces cinereoruber]|uniref:hypothetical protein n=1 Tax=Streptomyces cinereoruber TaxID=67260 RepID=UPI00363D502C
MLRTRIAETAAVAVLALGAVLLGTAATVAPTHTGTAAAATKHSIPTAGTYNMTWQ